MYTLRPAITTVTYRKLSVDNRAHQKQVGPKFDFERPTFGGKFNHDPLIQTLQNIERRKACFVYFEVKQCVTGMSYMRAYQQHHELPISISKAIIPRVFVIPAKLQGIYKK